MITQVQRSVLITNGYCCRLLSTRIHSIKREHSKCIIRAYYYCVNCTAKPINNHSCIHTFLIDTVIESIWTELVRQLYCIRMVQEAPKQMKLLYNNRMILLFYFFSVKCHIQKQKGTGMVKICSNF